MSKVRLAITGNMGSGKSVVSRMLAIMGVPVYDCDSRAKMLMCNDTALKNAIVRMFGEESYTPTGELNKAWLASRIFTDKGNIARMNALVHPCVKRDFLEWADAMPHDLVAVESAILYESGMIDTVDKVLLVWTDEDTVIERCVKRGGLTRSQVQSRLHNQMSADELIILSDFAICNDGNSPVLPQLMEIVSLLQNKNIV